MAAQTALSETLSTLDKVEQDVARLTQAHDNHIGSKSMPRERNSLEEVITRLAV